MPPQLRFELGFAGVPDIIALLSPGHQLLATFAAEQEDQPAPDFRRELLEVTVPLHES
jgi:hypothetical protein